MSGEFEKMDKEMMESLKEMRNEKIPEGLLKGFSSAVEQKILTRKIRPAGTGFGLAGVFALGFALLILGTVIWRLVPVKRPPVIPVPGAALTAGSVVSPSGAGAASVLKSIAVPQTASEISSEIEALRELGVWTEEDEEKIGIALEESFSELEFAFEDNTQFPAAPVAAG